LHDPCLPMTFQNGHLAGNLMMLGRNEVLLRLAVDTAPPVYGSKFKVIIRKDNNYAPKEL
jgi:hypothetical protein